MKKSVDPYDALASIFLPGGGSEDPDAWTEDRVTAEAETADASPEGADSRARAHTVDTAGATGRRDERTADDVAGAVDVAASTAPVMRAAGEPIATAATHAASATPGKPATNDDDLAAAAAAAAAAGSFGEAARAFAAHRAAAGAAAGSAPPRAGDAAAPVFGTLVPPGPTRPHGGRLPAPAPPAPPAVTVTSFPSSAAAADALLGGPRPRTGAARRRPVEDAAPLELELLVLGHLPIRASAWLVPSVRAIAGPDRAAGLLRCEGGVAELELHGPAPEPPDAASLAESITALRRGVRRWFLRPSSDVPSPVLAATEPDRVTILTGGDPVAVASAWEVARGTIAAADESGRPRPRLGLAVVGVPPAQAASIVEQLDRITRERLSATVELRCCVPRITPGGMPVAIVRSGAEDADPVRLSELVRGGAGRDHGADASPPPSSAGGSSPDAAARDPRREAGLALPPRSIDGAPPVTAPGHDAPLGAVLGSGFADERGASPGLPFVSAPLEITPAPSDASRRRNGSRPDAADDELAPLARIVPPADRVCGRGTAPARPTYARHVEGLRPLAARSPAHPDVELAVDADGTLHVLGGVASVRDLPLVADWAFTHAELLALACPDAAIDPSRRPQGHVFTDDPLAVSDLHRSHLHLHLLAELEIDGHRGWFSQRLHRPEGR